MKLTKYVGMFKGRDWIEPEMLGKNSKQDSRINDNWSREDWLTLIKIAGILKKEYKQEIPHTLLLNKTLFMLFFNDSLRTRNSFEAGMTQLGGHAHFLDPSQIYKPALPGEDVPYKTERISDVARVLSEMGDAISIRIYGDSVEWKYGKGHKIIQEFARWASIPLINMEDDIFHPCQALADCQTIDEHLNGKYKNKKYVMSYAYSGGLKPLAVPTSCVLTATMMGMDVVFARPKGFELEDSVIARCKEYTNMFGGSFEETDNMKEAFEGADVVYPKAWTPRAALPGPWGNRTAPDKELANKLAAEAKGWICDQKKMDLCNKKAIYMHCLPADRGQEVTDEVIDGLQSVVFDEAGNRMHSQKALMITIM
jgi:N-acetylornithine carbamoyltransferase